jgi:hypothetical protein
MNDSPPTLDPARDPGRIPGDVAMMPVPRCDACRHWKASMMPARGPCGMSTRRDGGLSVFMPDQRLGQVWTAADFGCVKFEARP